MNSSVLKSAKDPVNNLSQSSGGTSLKSKLSSVWYPIIYKIGKCYLTFIII